MYRDSLVANGSLDDGDIEAFVLALNDPARYEEQFGVVATLYGDFDADGDLDFDDIDEFVELLSPPASTTAK